MWLAITRSSQDNLIQQAFSDLRFLKLIKLERFQSDWENALKWSNADTLKWSNAASVYGVGTFRSFQRALRRLCANQPCTAQGCAVHRLFPVATQCPTVSRTHRHLRFCLHCQIFFLKKSFGYSFYKLNKPAQASIPCINHNTISWKEQQSPRLNGLIKHNAMPGATPRSTTVLSPAFPGLIHCPLQPTAKRKQGARIPQVGRVVHNSNSRLSFLRTPLRCFSRARGLFLPWRMFSRTTSQNLHAQL